MTTNPLWPVSVKGVLAWDGEVVVLRNDRDEWELPGGRLESTDRDAPAALRREMDEELGLDVEVHELLDAWIYDVAGMRVLIVTYRCTAPRPVLLDHSEEHVSVAAMGLPQLRSAPMPEGYLRSIESVLG